MTSTVMFMALYIAVTLPVLCISSNHKATAETLQGFCYRIVIHSSDFFFFMFLLRPENTENENYTEIY